MITIDLNMDLGEGTGNDNQVMPFISSCNIACGGHYGDYNSIKSTLLLAQKYDVKIGAHPSFEDQENFGRVYLDWNESRFRESVLKQIHLFLEVSQELEMPINHIKMHGALYHATANKPQFVNWTIQLMQEYFKEIPLYVPSHSLLEKELQIRGIKHFTEAFADRRYHSSYNLVSRKESNAVITDVAILSNQLIDMICNHQVLTVENIYIPMIAHTYCVHGDNEAIVNNFDKVRSILESNNIAIG